MKFPSSFWDTLMFVFAAALTLRADLTSVELAVLIAALAGTTLWGAE